MKNKKKILSLIACLSLLSSCNKGTSSSSSCSITTSTPTSSVTPSKTVEELNKELFENYANIVQSTGSLYNFLDNIPDEYLNLETIIIPEKVNGITINTLNNPSSGLFSKFTKLKIIKIPATVNVINFSDSSYSSKNGSPFINLPNLENIEVDSNNKRYYTKGNCLIQRVWKTQEGNRVPTGEVVAICGWKDVVIPEEITTLRNLAFTWNISITSITLHNNLTISKGVSDDKYYNFCNLDKLTSINPNGNTKYIVEEGTNILYDKDMASDNQYKIMVAWGDSVVPSSLNSVVAFSECTSLKSVDLTTNNVAKIGNYAFQNTQIEKINIPTSVTSIGSYAFLRMPYLLSLTADNNSKYVVKINEDGTSTNCLLQQSTNNLTAAWGDVIIPDNIENFQNFDFTSFSSIKSIKLNKKLKNIGNLASSPFTNINRYSSTFKEKRTIDEYFELVDNEENPYFRVINNCLVDVLNKAVICAFPDKKTGIVTFPDGYTTLKNGFRQDFFMYDLKGIDFNDIENIEDTSLVYDTDDNSQITEINLPSKLKSCSTYSGTMFLTNFTNIQTLTFDGKNSNDYFRIENNLLIENASDKLLFGFGDCKIPDNIKNLTDCPFLSKSIKSVEVHPNLESFVVGSSDGSFRSIPCNNFIFNGTLEQLKRQITVSEAQTKSILDELKDRVSTKSTFKVTYLDDNGNKVTKTLAEIE